MTPGSRPLRPSEQDEFSWIKLPGTAENLSSFQKYILDLVKQHEAPPDITLKIEMVLEEVLLNIINYAYSGDRPGIIKAGCLFSDEGVIVVRIIDQGVPFDPSSSPDPDTTLPLEDRDIGGLGIFLVRRMSDQVDYQRKDGQNILDIGFRL